MSGSPSLSFSFTGVGRSVSFLCVGPSLAKAALRAAWGRVPRTRWAPAAAPPPHEGPNLCHSLSFKRVDYRRIRWTIWLWKTLRPHRRSSWAIPRRKLSVMETLPRIVFFRDGKSARAPRWDCLARRKNSHVFTRRMGRLCKRGRVVRHVWECGAETQTWNRFCVFEYRWEVRSGE